MEMLHHAINWFEIPVADFDRAKKFYSTIYDFEMPEMQMGPSRMGFLLYERDKGGIGGAIVQSSDHIPSSEGHKIYLNGGANLGAVLARVEKAGGKVLMPKTLIAPELGFMGFFMDTEGNVLGLHSPQ